MLEKMGEFDGNKVIEEFEELTKDAKRVQEETLKRILQDNGQAEYLRKVGLNGRSDPDSFKECVPVVSHSDLEPYIQRIIEGDSFPILTGKPVTVMSLSSGTTEGRQKYVPFNDELFDTTMQIYQTSYAFRNREFPIQNGKALQFIYSSKQFNTKGGLAAGTATTNVFRHPQYLQRMKSIRSQSCSPNEVIFGPDFHQSLYCHLLCGLLYREEIQFVFSTFAHSIVNAFETFQQVWQELCTDIRTGVLSKRVTAPTVRSAMSQILKPDPELADLIHNKCIDLKNWYGMVPELFPNCKYIYGILTGSMEPYCKKLRHFAGSLPLVSADYGASEGWIAANVHPKLPPESATFVVLPQIGFFEFLPLKETAVCNGLEPKPVGLTEVEVGEEYEVVITSFAGLYRYKLGDTVKVMGFHNSTPELKFMCRSNLLLTINIDKNTEKDLQQSVEEASKILSTEKVELVDFSSFVDRAIEPGHYVIFWELTGGEATESVLLKCANCLDKAFVDAGYTSSRKVGGIGALELRILKKGTFTKIQEHYLSLGTNMSQFKTPRCVNPNNKSVLQILYNNADKSYFSTAYDL